MFTYIEIEPREGSYDVFYVVDDSELAEGRRCHIGEIRKFMAGCWQLRPAAHSQQSWTLDQDALEELFEKIVELNSQELYEP